MKTIQKVIITSSLKRLTKLINLIGVENVKVQMFPKSYDIKDVPLNSPQTYEILDEITFENERKMRMLFITNYKYIKKKTDFVPTSNLLL